MICSCGSPIPCKRGCKNTSFPVNGDILRKLSPANGDVPSKAKPVSGDVDYPPRFSYPVKWDITRLIHNINLYCTSFPQKLVENLPESRDKLILSPDSGRFSNTRNPVNGENSSCKWRGFIL